MDATTPEDIQARPSFRVGRIPVRIVPGFFVVSALLGLSGRLRDVASWVVTVFVSVLVHELGHALAIRRFGGEPSILLYGGGGLTYGSTAETPLRRLIVSLAGPFAGFALAGLTLVVFRVVPRSALADDLSRNLLWANVGWGLFNLLPMLPLDGGNALEALLALRFPARSRLVAELVTCVTSGLVVAAALWWSRPFLGVIALFWTAPTWRSALARLAQARDRDVLEALTELRQLRLHGEESALTLGGELIAKARTGAGRRLVAEQLALAHFERGDPRAGSALVSAEFAGSEVPEALWLAKAVAERGPAAEIDRLEREVRASDSLDVLCLYLDACVALDARERCAEALRGLDVERVQAALALRASRHFYAGRYAASLLVSEVGALLFASATDAYNAACCLAHLGRLDEAFAALEQAIAWEGHWPAAADDDADLVALRSDARWARLRAEHADR